MTPAPTAAATSAESRWRDLAAGPIIAAVTLAIAFVVTSAADVPLRDPNGVSVRRLLTAAGLVAVMIGLDLAIGRWRKRDGRRWTKERLLAVAIAIVAFYVTYLAYRNMKSVVPVLRPGDLYDHQLTNIDSGLFFGHDPAKLLQDVLGTGAAAHGLSAVYMFFFLFIPLALAGALVFTKDLRTGLFFTSALSLTWAVGAASYFLLPSIGPFDVHPHLFASLPHTPVTDMQTTLLADRAAFAQDPTAAGASQSIGAFASLHTAIYVTAGLAAHLLGFAKPIKIAIWVLTALTVIATVYFGWHYILDDIGGVAVSLVALAGARLLTGFDLKTARKPVATPVPEAA